ncbi:hypothetical protein NC652_025401 [Populus alba x Populus x berolinensis]|nr:hypothetical protein NC652_025401 [Populus alba x Populus x berolinensis]
MSSTTTTMSPPYQITESLGPFFPKTRVKQTQKDSIGDLEAFFDATATTQVVFPSFVGKKAISGTWKKWRELKKLQ